MKMTKKINFRQPKYMLPAILYFPVLGASYCIFDLFNAEKAEVPDKNMQTTEFLNPELPKAMTKGELELSLYNDRLSFSCKIDELAEYSPKPYSPND